MDLKTSQTQYTISLDAIDLNFIPTISKYNGHEVTQIWTKKNLTSRDNEYYEFEIMDENEDDGKTNQNTLTPCYICNTDIPKIFFRDHLNSNKHIIFKKIINASLDRMKKAVSNEIVYGGMCKDESIYFCESCVTVVSTQEKNSHENSARHRKSLAVDKILNDFLDIYTDNKKFSEGTEEGSNIRNCKNYNTLIRNNSEPIENNNSPCNQSTNHKIKESTYTNINSSHNQCVTLSKEIQTAALPVKNDNLKCFPVKEGGQKKEEIPTLPCQVVLKRKGTHIKGNSFYCAICNMYVPNYNYNIYIHLITAKHINNATKQAKEELIDVHYHMDLTKFPQLQCFVCKKSLPLNNTHNVTAHTLGSLHQQNHKLMLSNNKIIFRNGKYSCNVCHVVIDPMHEIIHCQRSSHLGKLPVCKIVKDTTLSNVSQEDHKIRRYLLKNDLKQQLCLVCNVKVPKGTNNVDSHLTGRVHNEKYNTILRENKIRSQGKNFKCALCDVIVPTGGEIQHIQTATHKRSTFKIK
ncbi:uncharacterized protein LOC121736354 isoform X2 [Aricia agestis]|uniref:uncharacterized protein LOC121736354 isoform X2 n=1 Tax=Aricia agestis TaxID=91739 RepID=UPI001C2062A8|nr:uncharacterized protein LOC121736354 isoform X2 [Aricia agestis]